MGVMTNYLSDALVNHVLRNVAYTSPGTVYLALFTSPTTKAGGGDEVAGGSYARQSIAFTDDATDGQVSQTSVVTFSGMPGCTVTHMAIMDALTSGNMLVIGALLTPRVVVAGTQFALDSGDIRVLFT